MTTSTITLPTNHALGELLGRFDSIYTEAKAADDRSRIPWDDGAPNPLLVRWLDTEAPAVLRCGSRVAVVGCGLGHDARELIRRGYEVTAFDISPTAIEWARRLDPDNADHYLVANVLEPPARWAHRFDLVVEINTIQSLPPECHGVMMEAIAKLVGMRGHLLVICRALDTPVVTTDGSTDGPGRQDDGPPWALTESELAGLAEASGLRADRVERIVDDETPPKLRFRALLHRGA